MNSIVILPMTAAARANGIVPMLPGRGAASTAKSPDAALHAYAAWLHMERRILCGEIWPHMGTEAERYTWMDNAGADWHFRGRGDLAWNEGQQPSARAASVLDLVGVDWRKPREDLGLNHTDSGHRPELPAGWPNQIDPVIELAKETIAAWSAYDDYCMSETFANHAMAAWEKRNPKPKMREVVVGSEKDYAEFVAGRSTYDPNADLEAAVKEWEALVNAWSARKRVAKRQSGLHEVDAEVRRLKDIYDAAAKKLRMTRPNSLRGIIAKARACYYSDCDNQIHYWQLMVDICKMFDGIDDDKLPELVV
jgi:hypothetical protein